MAVKVKAKVIKIKDEASARKALTEYESLKADAEALMVEHGITEMLEQADKLKKLVTEWAVENKVETIPMEGSRYYGLRQDAYNKRIVGDDEELAEVKNPVSVIPLKTIIKKKYRKGWVEIWKKVTTRRVDVAKLENAVKEGILSVDEISPAYYHDTKAPYIRSYGKE